jgi:hypothetical protein
MSLVVRSVAIYPGDFGPDAADLWPGKNALLNILGGKKQRAPLLNGSEDIVLLCPL